MTKYGSVFAAATLVLLTIWYKPHPQVLYGADAGCYARVADEIARRPLRETPTVTWGGGAFYEHPPGFMLAESLAFRAFGATPGVAIAVARGFASLVALGVFAVAWVWGGRQIATWSLVGLATLSGFHFESQNPMLEMPLTAALLLAALGASCVQRRAWLGGFLFALGFCCAAWVKGPPALAAFPLMLAVAWQQRWTWRTTLTVAVSAVGLLLASIAWFESWRQALELPPFWATYLEHQVAASLLHGRNSPVKDPLYFLRALHHWYPMGWMVLVAMLVPWLRRPLSGEVRALLNFAALWVLVLVIGFSIPVQKYHWYIHPAAPAFAWLCGGLLMAIMQRSTWMERGLRTGLLAAPVVYVGLTLALPNTMQPRRRELEAMQAARPPQFAAGEARAIAHCGNTGKWQAMHLFAFLWQASAVDCEAAAPYRFDGERIERID